MRAFAITVTCNTLIACGTTQTPTDRPQLSEIDHWQARGRIALKSEGKNDSLGFYWQQQGERSIIQLRGPMGWGSYEIATEGDHQELLLGAGFETMSADEKAAIQKQAAQLPIGQLRYWLRGLSPPEHAEPNRWDIKYASFQDVNGYTLPRKIQLSTAARSVKLFIRYWQLDGP